MKPIKFVHITDLHCSHKTDSALMDKAAALINNENPDVIVCTGDFVQKVHPDENPEEFHQIAKNFIDTLECKAFYNIPGNHDCYDRQRNNTLPIYKKYWQDENFSVNLEGLFMLGINSSVINERVQQISHSAGQVTDEAITYITETIQEANQNDFRVFCLHHHLIPMFNDTFNDDASGINLDIVWNSGTILRILKQNRFDLVLQGHKHDPEMFILDGTIFLIGSSLLKTLPEDINNYFHSIIIDELVTIKLHSIQSGQTKVIHCGPNKRYLPYSA